MTELPEHVKAWIGQPVVKVENMLTAGPELWGNFCAAIEDGNPAYWGDGLPENGGAVAPPAMLPAWTVQHEWYPNMESSKLRNLELHFMLKEALNLPNGIVGEASYEYRRPVRAGDRLHAEQILREIGDEYQTRLGPGRKWTIDVMYYHENRELAGIQTLRFTSYRKEQA